MSLSYIRMKAYMVRILNFYFHQPVELFLTILILPVLTCGVIQFERFEYGSPIQLGKTTYIPTPPSTGFNIIRTMRNVVLYYPKSNNPHLNFIVNMMEELSSGLRFIGFYSKEEMEFNAKETMRNSFLCAIEFPRLGDWGYPRKSEISIRFLQKLRTAPNRTWQANDYLAIDNHFVSGEDMTSQHVYVSEYFTEGFLAVNELLLIAMYNLPKYTGGDPAPLIADPDYLSNMKMRGFTQPQRVHDSMFFEFGKSCPMLIMIGFMCFNLWFLGQLADNKYSGRNAYHQILGMRMRQIWFVEQLIGLVMIMFIVVPFVFVMHVSFKQPLPSVLPKSNFFIICLFWLLYVTSLISTTTVISTLVEGRQVPIAIGGGHFILSTMPYVILSNKRFESRTFSLLVTFTCPNTAMGVGWQLIFLFETFGTGIQFSNLDQNVTVIYVKFRDVLVSFTIHIIICQLILLYVDSVNPGKFGNTKRWYYPFLCRKNVKVTVTPLSLQPPLFQLPPEDVSPIIEVRHLTMSYKRSIVLNNISFDIYQNHVTVVTGLNSSGKSTLVHLLSGLKQPTGGLVAYEGERFNIPVRALPTIPFQKIGISIRNSITYDEMTVKEHLYFICKLNGLSNVDTKVEVHRLLHLLAMNDSMDKIITAVSPSELRKVSIAMAFCGRPKIVFLEEPYQYQDDISKTCLWNLVKQEKEKGVTIVMSLTNLDRFADMADRIIVVHEKRLICAGTATYLSGIYGDETIMRVHKTRKSVDTDRITDEIHKHLPNSELCLHSGLYMRLLLSKKDEPFDNALEELNRGKEELGIRDLTIGRWTFDDVFNRAILAKHQDVNLTHPALLVNMKKFKRYQGSSLMWNKLFALIYQRITFMRRRKLFTLIRIIFPSIIVIVAMLSYLMPHRADRLYLKLDEALNPMVFLYHDNSSSAISRYNVMIRYLDHINIRHKEVNYDPDLVYVSMITELATNQLSIMMAVYYEMFSDTVYYNPNFANIPGVALNAYYGAAIWDRGYTVDVINSPYSQETHHIYREAAGMQFCRDMATAVNYAYSFLAGTLAIEIAINIDNKMKYLQLTNGVTRKLFWFAEALCDYVVYLVVTAILSVPVVIFQWVYLESLEVLPELFKFLVIFGIEFVLAVYVFASMYSSLANIFTDIVIGQLLGTLFSLYEHKHGIPLTEALPYVLDLVYFVCPFHVLNQMIEHLYWLGLTRLYCKKEIESCCGNGDPNSIFYLVRQYYCEETTCELEKECCVAHFKIDRDHSGKIEHLEKEIFKIYLIMAASIILYAFLIAAFESKAFKRKTTGQYSDPVNEDEAVTVEKERIRDYRLILLKRAILITKNLTKYYDNRKVVNGICLEFHRSQCFCFLGANCSGIQTMLNLLSLQIPPSGGQIFYNGYNNDSDVSLLATMFVCNLECGSFKNHMHVRDILIILLMIRGYTWNDCDEIALEIAKSFDYAQSLKKVAHTLSYGYLKRFLNSLVLIGDCPIVLLQMPSTGLDLKVKHRFWSIMKQLTETQHAVIINSHDTKECQIAADRLAIMVRGNLKCLGTMEEIEKKYMTGFILHVSLFPCSDYEKWHVEYFISGRINSAQLMEVEETDIVFHVAECDLSDEDVAEIMSIGKLELPIKDYFLMEPTLQNVFQKLISEEY